MTSDTTIRALTRDDREWVAHFLDKRWHSTTIVSRGRTHYGHLLPGFVAERASADDAGKTEHVGLITYNIEGNECELVTLDSLVENEGIGSALVEELVQALKETQIQRIWLVTTNDNLRALRFYQKRNFELVTIHRDAIAQARRIKPQIPIVGLQGIPIRDEIELERLL